EGEDVDSSSRVRLELPADVLDVRVDGPLVRLEGHPVDRVEELGPGEDPAGRAGERGEQLEFRRREIDGPAGKLGAHPRQVKGEIARSDDLVRRRLGARIGA